MGLGANNPIGLKMYNFTYTGTNSNQTITGLPFTPKFVLIIANDPLNQTWFKNDLMPTDRATNIFATIDTSTGDFERIQLTDLDFMTIVGNTIELQGDLSINPIIYYGTIWG